MSKLNFKIIKKQWKARVWKIKLNGIEMTTPVFMPVWTKATIKWMILDLLLEKKYIWNEEEMKIILANTFHLFLKPWNKLIKDAWWLHKFENRKNLILTDSWWFQVFSLWLWSNNEKLAKIVDWWVWFKSPYDWSKHFFNPENVVDIQSDFWSDIMMVLDVCSAVENSTKKIVNEQMNLTHKWADRAFHHFEQKYNKTRWVLFPIIQWWIYKDLREESTKYLSKYAIDWIAVWWLSVWESKDDMYSILKYISDFLPEDKPRYLMWVWTPEDIEEWIKQGIDMFDCVLPTRLWRHWSAFSKEWIIKLRNSKYSSDLSSLSDDCNCYCCKNFSKAYLNHLIKEKEMLWSILLSLHNISYLNNIVNSIRTKIIKNELT